MIGHIIRGKEDYLPQVECDVSYLPIVQSLLSEGAENSDILRRVISIMFYLWERMIVYLDPLIKIPGGRQNPTFPLHL